MSSDTNLGRVGSILNLFEAILSMESTTEYSFQLEKKMYIPEET